MKYILLAALALGGCISQKEIPLKETSSPVFREGTLRSLEEIKGAAIKSGYTISFENGNRIAFIVDVSKDWTWQDKSGQPINKNASVVIRKYRDIGANITLKPNNVKAEWIVEITGGELNITLSKLIVKYPTVVANNEGIGYSTGKFEPAFISKLK